MERKVKIPFQELLLMIKALPAAQKAELLKELEAAPTPAKDGEGFIDFLLNGPVYSENDIAIIENNTKSIAAWRTKG